MLYGNVELLNGEAIGTLVVLVKGDAEKQKQAREFLEKQNVTLTRLDEKGYKRLARRRPLFPKIILVVLKLTGLSYH